MELRGSIIVSCRKARSLIRFMSEPGLTRKFVLGFRNSKATNSTTGESSCLRPARRILLNFPENRLTADVLLDLSDSLPRPSDESAGSLNSQRTLGKLA